MSSGEAGAAPGQVHEQSGLFPLLIAAQSGHEGCVARLLAAGAAPGQLNEQSGVFPLLMAAQQGHEDCVARLLAAGAEPGQINEQSGAFPLLQATQQGHERCVGRLLAAGALPAQVNEQSGVLLMAAQAGHEGCVTRLLEAGAEPGQVHEKSGVFPLAAALARRHGGIAARLVTAGADPLQRHAPTGMTITDLVAVITANRLIPEDSGQSADASLPTAPVGIPVSWQEQALDNDLKADVAKGFSALGINLQDLLGIVSIERAPMGLLSLNHCVFTVRQANTLSALDAVWISWGSEKPALLLGPGVDLDGICISLGNAGLLPDLQKNEAMQIWAAMALLCTKPPRLPLVADRPLPLPHGVELPNHSYPDEYWPSWRFVWGGRKRPMWSCPGSRATVWSAAGFWCPRMESAHASFPEP